MDEKTNLRILAKNIREELQIDVISKKLCKLIRQNDYYKDAKNVMIFYPKHHEIDLRELLNDDKKFYLPRVKGNNLEICRYVENDKLKKSAFGVLEPCNNPCDICILDLVILPALIADKEGYRLGYGGGYYDRFLANKPLKLKTIVALPEKLIVETIPHNKYDIKCDCIIKCK